MSNSISSPVAPQWAPRVSMHNIAKIYRDKTKGLYDEALLNEITLALLMRCNSMIIAEEARKGRVTCPVCGKIIEHDAKKGTLLACPYCLWKGTWDAYLKSMDGLHLIAPEMIHFCEEFCAHIKPKFTPKEMMHWVDWLIYQVHQECGAVCLIQGNAADVNEFLAQLTDGNTNWEIKGK